MYTFKNKQAVHKFTPTLALKTYKISKARLMIYNSNLVPQKYRFMAPIHPKMVEYEPWSGWYKQVTCKRSDPTFSKISDNKTCELYNLFL